MRIAVVGLGAIGSTFAFALSKAGHEVTGIARGERLEQVQRDGAIVKVDGERAAIATARELDPAVPFDLVLVAVLAHQVEPILPTLRASAAKTVLFMFNTVAPLANLRDVVGAERFAFGFPAVLASLPSGRLQYEVFTFGQITIVTEARWAELFTAAGIKTHVEPHMQSWLRTHAVVIAVVLSLSLRAVSAGRGATWAEASGQARAFAEGLALVRHLGERVTPMPIALLGALPGFLRAALFWVLSRTPLVRSAAAVGPKEPRALIDAMAALGPPALTEGLRAIRPAD
ncbi:MAG: 2-dehydropantoate 2-reductase N-terminal domain-containing protein [Myxococcaceae bacterium]